jgi:lysozyme
MQISEIGIDLIKSFEGLQLKKYICPAGKETIGYGHAIKSGENIPNSITEKKAEELLRQDLQTINAEMNILLAKILPELTQNMYDAMSSLIYNVGITAFKGRICPTKCLQALIKKDFSAASTEMFSKEKGYCKCRGKIMKGLVDRRERERQLFNLPSKL